MTTIEPTLRPCSVATSPLAYLADLLDYATQHVKDGAGTLTLAGLAAEFHQPFADLPGSCESMARQASQVRLCVEVLRAYLKSKTLPAPGSRQLPVLEAAQQTYRLAAYEALLSQLGASFDDLRLARTAPEAERAELAARLGIAVEKLDALPLVPTHLTEQVLEKLFGLADTGRDPLSEGAKSGDAQRQVPRWNLEGVDWGRNTDAEGAVYLRLKKSGNAFQATLFRDAARSQQVAGGARSTASGPVTLGAVGGSGLSGSLLINYTADSDAIAIAAVPALLAWRFQGLREQWRQQDAEAGAQADAAPVIDPDVIAESDLRNAAEPDAAFQLWKTRRDFVAAKLTGFKTLRLSKPTALAGLDAVLTQAGLPSARLQALAERMRQGESIGAEVEALGLPQAGFACLLRVRTLAAGNSVVLDAEWVEVESILVQVLKRHEFAAWRTEEQSLPRQITLSPDFFRIDGSGAALLPWRATASARRDWQERLQARCDQERDLIAASQAAVRATEDATLPALRDALILASDAQGGDLSAKARWLTDLLLIDMEADTGQPTTRIGQAIETVQGLLMSLRTGQISDSHPALTLAADRFDEEWEWLGSFVAWRAAMMIYLYPENLLLPTLRRRQTPAFRALVSQLRGSRRLSPLQARVAAGDYESYFRDVCSLAVASSCVADTKKANQSATESLFYLFAVGGKTRALYWSACNAGAGADPAQTFWEPLPPPAGFVKFVSSVPFATSEGRRFVFLFSQTLDKGKPALSFLRYDLDERTWDEEWTALDLPTASGTQLIVAVQNQNEDEAPSFFIRASSGIHVRGLAAEGSAWESPGTDEDSTDDWEAFRVRGTSSSSDTWTLRAVLRTANQPPGTYWWCQHVKNRGVVVRKLRDMLTVPQDVGIPVEMGGASGTFVGAYAREATDEIVVLYREGLKRVHASVAAAVAQSGTVSNSSPPVPVVPGGTVLSFTEVKYRRVRAGSLGAEHVATSLAGLQSLVPRYDGGQENQRQMAWQKSAERLRGVVSFNPDTEAIAVSAAVRTAPKVDALIPIVEDKGGVSQEQRRLAIRAAVDGNKAVESHLTYVAEACYFVPVHLALQLQTRGQFTSALDWLRTVYDYRLPAERRKIYHGLKLEETQATSPATLVRPADWFLDPLNPHAIAATRAGAHSRGTLLSLIGCVLDFADAEFTRDSAESLPRARMLYLTAVELLGAAELQRPGPQKLAAPVPGPTGDFDVPASGVLVALRFRTELNLFKLRMGRNIAGLERQVEPYAAPTNAGSALPGIGAGGQITLPGAAALRPTPYRYPVLIERAKQMVQLAAQMEAAMLAAFEKRDAELYTLLKARQDVKLTRAGVRLQDMRVREAEAGVKLAELQQQRAQIQQEHFEGLLNAGLLGLEAAALVLLGLARFAPALVNALGPALSPSGMLETASGILATMASNERRRQDWEFQSLLSVQDIRIGAQQVRLAEDHVRITGQERLIAEVQADHAEATLEFLAGKFTSAELFDWMSGVLEGVFSFFLQQATAVAKLAENQLAFERQDTPPAFIQADYWEATADAAAAPSTDGPTPDRRGLTGSARLLQDIFKLDQHAFETDQRKLQLTRTFSLARLAPVEFQQFRDSGVMLFATPMELFDRDFPGHYLRLIKRVRTSVIALIPPSEGIRATLSTPGISRVTTSGGGAFPTTVISQGPQSVALCAPRNASGLFELDLQPEMLLPFEGTGVHTVWRLVMAKASNPFDYRTLADILLTIEYTALDSPDYRQQVIGALDANLSADRPLSLRHQFADAWYDLHNPAQTAQPMTVRFRTQRQDFPPNVEQLRIQHVTLFIARADGKSFEVNAVRLRFTDPSGAAPVDGGAATSVNGLISTRNGNGSAWTSLIGKEPFGEWELALPDSAETQDRFKNEEIEDILLVVTYTGRTPRWPG